MSEAITDTPVPFNQLDGYGTPEGLFLKKLSDYAYYMYCTPMGAERFAHQNHLTFQDREIAIKVQENGRYLIDIVNTDVSADIDVAYVTIPCLKGTMLNMSPRFHILNLDEIPEEYHDFLQEAAIFVVSLSQRTIAFQFFAGISHTSMASLEAELGSLQVKPKSEPSEES